MGTSPLDVRTISVLCLWFRWRVNGPHGSDDHPPGLSGWGVMMKTFVGGMSEPMGWLHGGVGGDLLGRGPEFSLLLGAKAILESPGFFLLLPLSLFMMPLHPLPEGERGMERSSTVAWSLGRKEKRWRGKGQAESLCPPRCFLLVSGRPTPRRKANAGGRGRGGRPMREAEAEAECRGRREETVMRERLDSRLCQGPPRDHWQQEPRPTGTRLTRDGDEELEEDWDKAGELKAAGMEPRPTQTAGCRREQGAGTDRELARIELFLKAGPLS